MKTIIITAIVILVAVVAIAFFVIKHRQNNCLYAKLVAKKKHMMSEATKKAHGIANDWAHELVAAYKLRFDQKLDEGVLDTFSSNASITLNYEQVDTFQYMLQLSNDDLEQQILKSVNENLRKILYGRKNVKHVHHNLYSYRDDKGNFVLSLYF